MSTPKKSDLPTSIRLGMRPLLVSIPAAADHLGIGSTLMRELVKRHELQVIELGARRLLRLSEVESIIRQTCNEE